MSKCFFVIVDKKSLSSVTTMPSVSLCQDVIANLPAREGYEIFKVPTSTKFLDVEFAERLTAKEVQDYYEGTNIPLGPQDWYSGLPRTDRLSKD